LQLGDERRNITYREQRVIADNIADVGISRQHNAANRRRYSVNREALITLDVSKRLAFAHRIPNIFKNGNDRSRESGSHRRDAAWIDDQSSCECDSLVNLPCRRSGNHNPERCAARGVDLREIWLALFVILVTVLVMSMLIVVKLVVNRFLMFVIVLVALRLWRSRLRRSRYIRLCIAPNQHQCG
jgi:Flp pilus assembly protein TadB